MVLKEYRSLQTNLPRSRRPSRCSPCRCCLLLTNRSRWIFTSVLTRKWCVRMSEFVKEQRRCVRKPKRMWIIHILLATKRCYWLIGVVRVTDTMKKIALKAPPLPSARKESSSSGDEDGRNAEKAKVSQLNVRLADVSGADVDGTVVRRKMSLNTSQMKSCGPPSPRSGNGIFNTIRRKFNQYARGIGCEAMPCRNNEHMHANANGNVGHGRAHLSLSYRIPVNDDKGKSGSLRGCPATVERPLRAAYSEEVLKMPLCVHPQTHSHDCEVSERSIQIHSKRNGGSRAGEKSPIDQIYSEPFPLDTEYGHASAPLTNGMDGCDGMALDGDSDNATNNLDDCFEVYNTSTLTTSVHRFQPVYDQVKEGTKTWCLTQELFKLTKFGWYWGPINREEAEEKLLDHPDGAFLVRDSSDERYLLSLSFRSYNRTLHTRIEHCNGVFSFYTLPESEGYSSIVDLIEHSMNDSQAGVFCYSRARVPGSPSFPVRLTKPVSRFSQVRTLQYLCRFVIRQYTRFDHIQKLPLPNRIKGWLEENQYWTTSMYWQTCVADAHWLYISMLCTLHVINYLLYIIYLKCFPWGECHFWLDITTTL